MSDEWEGQTNDGEELPVGTYFYTMLLRRWCEAKKRMGIYKQIIN
jgi:hypothetical protein